MFKLIGIKYIIEKENIKELLENVLHFFIAIL